MRRLTAGLVTLVVGIVAIGCYGPRTEEVSLKILRTDFLVRDIETNLVKDALADGDEIQPWHFGKGWGPADDQGRWAFGRSVELEVMTLGGGTRFWIECKPYAGLKEPQRVEISLNGETVGSIAPEGREFEIFDIELPRPLVEGAVTFGLCFSSVCSPRDAGQGSDTRPLAIKVRRIGLTRGSTAFNDDEVTASVVGGGQGLTIEGEGRLFVNSWFERPVAKVRFGWSGEPRGIRAVVLRDPECGAEMGSYTAEDENSSQGTITLMAGGIVGPVQLVIDTGPGVVEITDIVADVAVEGPKVTPRRKLTSQPDIIVFLLDAARADHCGRTYGYSRDTAPVLDGLATEALVFEQVIAQAPYTTCSVPTMFTGVAWGAHGVIRGRDRLSDGETTLAEAMKDNGYRTIGVTATPNNSRNLGMSQGFDVFKQLWEDVDWLTSIDPLYAAEQVEALLGDVDPEKPLFLMVHLVPPHSPYTPPDRFRFWSDADYDGPCDGSNEYLGSIREHRDRVSAADLAEMIALYDANLRFSDVAVGRILDMLKERGRLEGAVVAITADHGEAFFEHGKLDHNSTVYDEMLHVPLVLSVPPELEVENVNFERLASLEDLTPTLLDLAGIESSARSTGISLFSAVARTGILLRTSASQHVLGFRTDRWKLIDDGRGRFSRLYDLKADPLERDNVIVKNPGVVSFLAVQWARAEAALPPSLDVTDVGMTDQEKNMLFQLGYIETDPGGPKQDETEGPAE